MLKMILLICAIVCFALDGLKQVLGFETKIGLFSIGWAFAVGSLLA